MIRLSTSLAALTLLTATPLHAQWTNRYPKVDGYNHQVYLEGYELPTLASGPLDPAASPDGRRLAVAERGWIWIVDMEQNVARQFTTDGGMDSRPAWSPDGARIAFVRDDGSDTHIVVMDVGTGQELFTIDEPAIDLDPTFGPSGDLWYASGVAGTIDIWRMDDDSGERVRITDGAGIELRPQLSADGSLLLYLSKIRGGEDRIVLRDLTTGDERILHEGRILSQMRPALSPDGRRVAYNVPQGQGDGWELRVASTDRAGSTMMVFGGAGRLPLTPAWSHDGSWIYFSEATHGEVMELQRVAAVGGHTESMEIGAWRATLEMGLIRIRTSERSEDAPVPSRMSLTGADGHPFFPTGSQPRFDGQNGKVFFYSPGWVEVEVPVGEVTVEAVRGLATPPARATVRIQAGATTEVDLSMEPVWDAAAEGWLSGDQHFHLNYGGPYRLDPEDLILQARAEGLDVGTPLVANLHARLGEQQWFAWSSGGELPLLRFGQEVRSHFLGHIGLIGTDELFWPWVWGPGYQVYGADDRTNTEVTAHARAQGGLASYVHPAGSDPFATPGARSLPVELIADGVLGNIDAIEVACLWSDELGTSEVWYRLLNLGWPVAATSGSDVMTNFYRTMAMGSTRTYVHTGDRRDFDSYLEGLRAGRSFVTNGPLLDFRVDESQPGGTVVADGSVDWTLDLHTAVPVETVEIIVNGKVVWSGAATGSATSESFSGVLDVPTGGWIAARVTGPATVAWPAMDSYAFAHSSPVWIGEVGSIDPVAERQAVEELLAALGGARENLEAGYQGNDIPKLRALFDRARAALEARSSMR